MGSNSYLVGSDVKKEGRGVDGGGGDGLTRLDESAAGTSGKHNTYLTFDVRRAGKSCKAGCCHKVNIMYFITVY